MKGPVGKVLLPNWRPVWNRILFGKFATVLGMRTTVKQICPKRGLQNTDVSKTDELAVEVF